MQRLQDLPIDEKCAKRNEGCHEQFPCRAEKTPPLSHPDTEGIDHKQNEQCPMDRPQNLNQAITLRHILQGHAHKNQDEQGDTFQEGEEPQAANAGIEVLFHIRNHECKAVAPKVKMAKESQSK